MLKRKLFSVLLVSYKNLPYIYDAINSVLDQDYPDIELIICDDGTEEFQEKEYADYIKLNNKGNIKLSKYSKTLHVFKPEILFYSFYVI